MRLVPSYLILLLAICSMGMAALASAAQQGETQQGEAPQREEVRDPNTLLVQVLEADGTPSPRRRITFLDGAELGTGGSLVGEGLRTDADGRLSLDRAAALRKVRQMTGGTMVQLWVGSGSRHLVHTEHFDLAKTLELEIRLKELARVIVTLPDLPAEVYPKIFPADLEEDASRVRFERTADRLDDGSYRFDGIDLERKWRLHLYLDTPDLYGSTHCGLDGEFLPGPVFLGPTELGEEVRVDWKPQGVAMLRGRFVDEQGADVPLNEFAWYGLSGMGSPADPAQADIPFAVGVFADGSFLALAQPMEQEKLKLPLAIKQLHFRWAPPDTGGYEELERALQLADSMNMHRASTLHFDRQVGAEIVDLGEVKLSREGALLEVAVKSEAGIPIELAALELQTQQPDRHGAMRWFPVHYFYPMQSRANGIARFFAPSWERALRPNMADPQLAQFKMPTSLRLRVEAEGYHTREIAIDPNARRHEIILKKGKTLRGRLRSSQMDRIRDKSSLDLMLAAVPVGQGAMGSGEVIAEQRLSSRDFLSGDWVEFELADLPGGPMDLVLRTYSGKWDLARHSHVVADGTEIDIDAQLEWAMIGLRNEVDNELGPRQLEGAREVLWQGRSPQMRAHFTPVWVEGRQWIPLCRANLPMDLRLRLPLYTDIELPAIAPGAYEFETRSTYKLKVELEGFDEAHFKKPWKFELVPVRANQEDRYYYAGATEPNEKWFSELMPGAHELRWSTLESNGSFVARATRTIDLTMADFQAGFIKVAVPREFLDWVSGD